MISDVIEEIVDGFKEFKTKTLEVKRLYVSG